MMSSGEVRIVFSRYPQTSPNVVSPTTLEQIIIRVRPTDPSIPSSVKDMSVYYDNNLYLFILKLEP